MFTEKVNVYRFSGVGPLGFAALAVAAVEVTGEGGVFAGGAAAAAGAGTLPKANARLSPKFTEKKLGPMP